MNHNYLIYFCDSVGSVFESQVLALLNEIKDREVFKKIYLFLGVKNEDQKKDFLERKLNIDLDIVFYRTYPNYPFFNFLIRKSIKTSVKGLNINFKDCMFHTRGEMIAWQLTCVLGDEYNKNIIPDIRGASIEEINEFYNSNRLLKHLKILNNKNAVKNLSKFNLISVVSDSLKNYLIINCRIDDAKILTTPCLADKGFKFDERKRNYVRKELGLNKEDTLIVFASGGTANWQNNNAVLKLAEKEIKVLNLSKKIINHKNIINKFVCYSEMPDYLNAADVAIIWRDNSVVNKVASPVKFSEYICCGLPVIANNSVDLIKSYITQNKCGLIIEDLEELDQHKLIKLMDIDRKQISGKGVLNFGLDEITQKYLSIYLTINTL